MAHGYDAIRLWMEAPLDIRKRYLMSSINLNGLLTQVLPSAGGVIWITGRFEPFRLEFRDEKWIIGKSTIDCTWSVNLVRFQWFADFISNLIEYSTFNWIHSTPSYWRATDFDLNLRPLNELLAVNEDVLQYECHNGLRISWQHVAFFVLWASFEGCEQPAEAFNVMSHSGPGQRPPAPHVLTEHFLVSLNSISLALAGRSLTQKRNGQKDFVLKKKTRN